MKRYTNLHLDVSVDVNLDEVKSIRFLFVQRNTRIKIDYPSSNAFRDGDRILIKFDRNQTGLFVATEKIRMDTYIQMNGSTDNPESQIAEFHIHPTMFRKEELPDD